MQAHQSKGQNMSHIVVIGAGQAGSSLVAKLRKTGFDGDVTLIGEEPVLPYQRPPLSKGYLLGDMGLERLYLRPEAFYTDQNITLHLGQRVTGIDPASQTIDLGDAVLRYSQLALTTGSAPRHLPASIGGNLGGVHVVRTLSDVDHMAAGVTENARVLIVGGGYIGLEAAAVCAKKGMQVVLVEMAERILQRVAAAATSDFFRDLHTQNGVDIREGVGLTRLLGETRVEGAILTDGTQLALDMVIVGVGITPGTALADAAGLTLDNGIATDALGRTSDRSIWSAGDCASFVYRGSRIRLESVQNAIDQAECVAENMLGADKPYLPKPWFWSDQYDVKLQIAGLNSGYDRTVTRPGDKPGTQSVWYYEGETLRAVDAMNDPRAYMIGKRLIEADKSPAAATIADPSTALKSLLG